MDDKIPKVKKKISDFLLGEEGKISKQSLIALGAFLGSAAISTILNADVTKAEYIHSNDLPSTTYSEGTATGTHTHHSSHSSY